MGGGAELSTCTDFRIMRNSPSAYIKFVHARIGAAPGWGGTKRLVSIVGRTSALDLLASSRALSAEEALKLKFADLLIDPALSENGNKIVMVPFNLADTSIIKRKNEKNF